MRKLASIKVINNIAPIEGRDKIVLATVDGWNVIVKKDEFQVGDKCIYCEIDSVMPETEYFEFLRSKKFRIKTMKMAGVISQGICFPLNILPKKDYKVDEDVTDVLGITQYEPTMDIEPKVKKTKFYKYPKFLMRFNCFRQLVYKLDHRGSKGFPSFISKTDETRIQNAPFYLEDKREWIVTEKIDGQSGTFCLVKKKSKIPFLKSKFEYIVCSRNLRLFKKDTSSYWTVSDKYNIEQVLKNIIGNNEWVCLQGECISPKVQGNKYKVSEPDLYAFNLIYPTGRLSSIAAKKILKKENIKFVPILDEHFILPNTVNEMLEYAHGESILGNTIREGVVVRSVDGKQSFKAVDPLFLIKYDE